MGISLDGKCAIITGAANGVGLAIARTFAIAGANVVLSDMDEENLLQETKTLSKSSSHFNWPFVFVLFLNIACNPVMWLIRNRE